MEFADIAIVSGFVIVYALVSRRIETTPITGPIVFVAVGIMLGTSGFDLLEGGLDEGAVRVLAETTLVLLLFTDAIRIDIHRLRRQIDLPGRLLGIGLPLTVVGGTAVAMVLLPGLGLWEAALVAAILSPTDAALGQAVVANVRVPARIRQALNVESGLNDGIMLPVITLLLALAAVRTELESTGYWAEFAARQIGFGVLVGVAIGWVGGRLLDLAAGRGWVDGAFRQLATLSIGVAAFGVAEVPDGNGFVAAFVAGLAFGAAARDHCEGAYDFAEDEGQLLALLTFLFFGAAIAGPALDELTWRIALYSLLSLTVIRMAPVAIGLAGTKLRWQTVVYIGWFGPRGLASILFGLFILEEAALPVADELFLVVVWTVIASVVLHGVTSVALSNRYAAWFNGRSDAMPESEPVEVMPTR